MGIALKALIVGEESVPGRDEGEKRWVSDIERMVLCCKRGEDLLRVRERGKIEKGLLSKLCY